MVTFRQPGTVLTDHRLAVPLRHDDPGGEHIEVYAREVVAADKEHDDLPWLLFLQGGPGFAASRPIGRDSWLDRALRDYRVLLLDQRGTGRSTRADRHSVTRRGDAAAQADYLACFRADAIVRDAELLRQSLLGDRPWSVLGQSFGGFCALTYLSFAPEGLREVLIAGGLAGLDATADDVYRATYPHVEAKNAAHYRRYPGDVEAVRAVARHLLDHDVRLPNGARLTVEGFQSLGVALGGGEGSHELHYLVEEPFTDAFLAEVYHRLDHASAPLYALVHEACYAQGRHATGWAAQRIRAEFPQFDAAEALAGDRPVLFTGEMIYPAMFDADPALAPLAEAADLLARRDDWPVLYDADRLAANTVPVAAVVYHDDMYVDRELSLRTAAAVAGLRVWVTNEHEHDGLRVSAGAVLDRLIDMVRGRV